MSYLILVIVITLVSSAFFSGMEIAFVSANKLRVELDKKQKRFPSRILTIFFKKPAFYITSMLVGNNLALVIYGIYMSRISDDIYGFEPEFLYILTQTFVSTIFILILAEFLPKALFRLKPNNFLNVFAVPVMVFYILIFPITWSITHISNYLLRKFFKFESQANKLTVFNKVDITNLILEENNPSIENAEKNAELKIFQNALEFSKVKLRDCMIPRPEICALESGSSLTELKNNFIETNYSKILIFKENIDNIIGYINSKDFFKNPTDIESCLIKLPFYPETMAANKLLREFIKNKKNIAVVVDEFGGTSGIVTIEDVMEEIFGEIEDEHDEVDLVYKQLGDKEYIFSGRVEIDHINDNFQLGLPVSDEYETLAGYILYHHENVPQVQEELQIDKFKFRILKVSKTKLELIKLEVL